MDKVTDRCDARPPGFGFPEEFPAHIEKFVALAEPAGQQEHQHVVWQVLHRDLACVRRDRVELTVVANDRIGGDAHGSSRGNHPAAPIAKSVAVSCQQRRRARDDVVRINEVADAAVVDAEGEDARGWLRELVVEFVTKPELHVDLTDFVNTTISATIAHFRPASHPIGIQARIFVPSIYRGPGIEPSRFGRRGTDPILKRACPTASLGRDQPIQV